METQAHVVICATCRLIKESGRVVINHNFGPDCGAAKGPLTVACPVCQSPVGRLCTQPTNIGRTVVRWFHMSRENAS